MLYLCHRGGRGHTVSAESGGHTSCSYCNMTTNINVMNSLLLEYFFMSHVVHERSFTQIAWRVPINHKKLSCRRETARRFMSLDGLISHYTVAQSFCFYQHQTIQTSSRNSDGVTPCGGAKYRWGIKISRFSTNKSLYFAKDARYRHSYYGRRIGTRMRSIKWCHFQ